MAIGYKTGGRQPGTPNKATAELQQKLAALGCDPIVGMATIAENLANSVEIRLKAYSELCQYVYPKRRAVDVGGDPDVGIQRVISAEPLTSEEWLERYGRKERGDDQFLPEKRRSLRPG
jgi:hypothetical protein